MLCTRPDICYSVGMVSRYQSNPRLKHWQAIKHILKYLRRTWDYMLVYHSKDLIPIGYTDSDFQSNLDWKKSTSGCVFTLRGGAINWRSVKQSCIADATMEVEYVAACETAKDAVWFKKFLSNLGVVRMSKFVSHCFATIVERLHNPRIQEIIRKESIWKESTISFETLLLEEM